MEQVITRENVQEAVEAVQGFAPGFEPQVAVI